MIKSQRNKRIKFYIALYLFAGHWHSGETSRGYRLCCLAAKRPRRYDVTDRDIAKVRYERGRKTIVARYYEELYRKYYSLV